MQMRLQTGKRKFFVDQPRVFRAACRTMTYVFNFEAVDATPLRTFRSLFGLAIFMKSFRCYLKAGGYVKRFYFKWPALQDLAPATPSTLWGMQMFFCSLGAVALLLIVCGPRTTSLYRFSTISLSGLYLWFFSFDAASYNNHYYLIWLLSLFFCVTDAHLPVVPQWQLKLFQVQIATVYFFAGLCKLNSEWLRGYPPRFWLFEAYDRAFAEVFREAPKAKQLVIKDALSILPEIMTWVVCYGGAALDLTLPFILLPPDTYKDKQSTKSSRLRKKLRHFGIWLSVVFHGFNSLMFNIGIFPFMMICTTVLFMTPSEISAVKSIVARCWCWHRVHHDRATTTDKHTDPNTELATKTSVSTRSNTRRRLVIVLLCIHWSLQWSLPLRHFVINHWDKRLGPTGQSVGWTGAGELFAWRMMLTSKVCTGYFEVVRRCECSGIHCCPREKMNVLLADRISRQNIHEERLHVSGTSLELTSMQQWRLFTAPFFTRQAATRGVSMLFPDSPSGWKVAKVYAHAQCSLNGSPTQPYLNASVNMMDGWSWSWGQLIDPIILPQKQFI